MKRLIAIVATVAICGRAYADNGLGQALAEGILNGLNQGIGGSEFAAEQAQERARQRQEEALKYYQAQQLFGQQQPALTFDQQMQLQALKNLGNTQPAQSSAPMFYNCTSLGGGMSTCTGW